jgi:hypothetical protein
MSIGLLFWILMLLWLLFGLVLHWSPTTTGAFGPYGVWGHNLLLFVLLFLVGWQVFGAPIK